MVDYKCFKCNKDFISQSKLDRHYNRKIPCNKTKVPLECKICNVNFQRPSEKERHEKTKKHITNVTINGNNNINNINSNIDNSFNNIVNLTLNMNSFKDTDLSYVGIGLIRDIGYVYLEILNNNRLNIIEKVTLMFDEVILILKKLHFNIGVEENHNLKILLVFPGLKHKTHEYLILEINKETKYITWKSVDYKVLLINILDHLLILNNHGKNENYIQFVNYLKKNIIEDEEQSKELQPIINDKLSKMYINFNKEQKKPDRDIEETFNEKLEEYLTYRSKECRLINGFNPTIENTQFK
jgi:hypothetical protein